MSNTPEQTVISNTSPLYYLHRVNRIDLLRQLYNTVLIPPAVERELAEGRRLGFDAPDTASLRWLKIRPVQSRALVPIVVDLGAGEAEAIALGLENPGSLLLLDDHLARQIARLQGLTYTGTLGVLVKAKQMGLIPSVKQLIEMLRQEGMWITDAVVQTVLDLAGE
jgi:predicted nucleic acid-binding protein